MRTLQESLVVYKTYAKAEGKSPKTISWVVSSVNYFGNFLGSERQNIAEITGDDLRRFIIALKDRPKYVNHPYNKPQSAKLSLLSIDTYCRGITAFFSFLKREGFLELNPLEKVKRLKTPKVVIPTYNEKEIIKLLTQPDRHTHEGFRDFAIMLTFIDSGIRLSEMANLQVNDINFDQYLFRVMGKGQKERYVPFGKRVAKALMDYLHKHRPEPIGTENFWLRYDGLTLTPDRIQKLVTGYGRKAGLKRCHCHKLRHTSAVQYLRNGGDPFSLQKKLGHSSLTMTRHYSELADEDIRDKHLRYGVADRLKI